MGSTKLIYGVGRVPKASEFVLGDIVVNVDDSKVYSKNKNNSVFELGTGASLTFSGSIDTGSFYTSSSLSGNVITFNQGDGTTEQIDLTPIVNASSDDDWYIDTGVKITSSLSIYVEGIISSSQYLILNSQENTTGVAGALLYSASNEFYLGFS